MRALHVPLMYRGCECVCDLVTRGPGLLRVKKTHVMTKFEHQKVVL